MFFQAPQNYLEYRHNYLKEFFFNKNSIINSISMNTDFIDPCNFRVERKKNSTIENLWDESEDFKKFKVSDSEYININELKWIKKGRISWMVANSLFMHYRSIRKSNNYPPTGSLNENCSPVDFFYHGNKEIKLHEVVLLIDILSVFSGRRTIWVILEHIKKCSTSLLKKYQEPFKFISGSSELNWLLGRFDRKGILWEGDVNKLLQNSDKKIAISVFDFWALRNTEPEVKLFLLETKKALSQKKFRDKVKDKEVLNTYISKLAKRRLKYLAKKHELNINEILEILILGDDKKSQSQRLIEALESTIK
ncbi:hypothetical protein ABN225_13185 [Providencia alcalifaciens]